MFPELITHAKNTESLGCVRALCVWNSTEAGFCVQLERVAPKPSRQSWQRVEGDHGNGLFVTPAVRISPVEPCADNNLITRIRSASADFVSASEPHPPCS